jgi:hypothetical protein
LAKIAEADSLNSLKGSKDIKCSKPTELTVAGHKAYTAKITSTYHDRPANSEYTIFTPDGETYFLIDFSGDVAKLVASIKAVK